METNKLRAPARERKDFFVATDFSGPGGHAPCGPGSIGEFAKHKQRAVMRFWRLTQSRSVLDIGCGDLSWMAPAIPQFDSYTGIDINPAFVDKNQNLIAEQSWSHCRVYEGDVVLEACEIPQAHLVVFFEVAIHLLEEELISAINNILRSKPTFLAVLQKNQSSKRLRGKTRWENIRFDSLPELAGRPIIDRVRYDYGEYQLFQIGAHEKPTTSQ